MGTATMEKNRPVRNHGRRNDSLGVSLYFRIDCEICGKNTPHKIIVLPKKRKKNV